ncbi:hypothetical protein PAHA111176_17880 [Parendozoicomonas haliclonae]|uniref:Uncharacterized protein n=1 Tax=Parendozoicomonas haliclonae TaxID=1960125 RepID=A0A1X7AP77_9GAMM|nr:hypothetical protein EHSB41UT_03713 [Parendozoicomonas haliclonae]
MAQTVVRGFDDEPAAHKGFRGYERLVNDWEFTENVSSYLSLSFRLIVISML